MTSPTKTQRLLDLIAFLMGRRVPVTVEEIMEGVPAYAAPWRSEDETARASARRAFERDKALEREEGTERPDGSAVVERRAADPGWAVRHALRYGADAEVVEPPEMRGMVREAAERVEGLHSAGVVGA